MKICSACGATYTDRIDFCFSDGSILVARPVTGADTALDVPVPQHLQAPDLSPGAARTPDPSSGAARTPDPSSGAARTPEAPPGGSAEAPDEQPPIRKRRSLLGGESTSAQPNGNDGAALADPLQPMAVEPTVAKVEVDDDDVDPTPEPRPLPKRTAPAHDPISPASVQGDDAIPWIEPPPPLPSSPSAAAPAGRPVNATLVPDFYGAELPAEKGEEAAAPPTEEPPAAAASAPPRPAAPRASPLPDDDDDDVAPALGRRSWLLPVVIGGGLLVAAGGGALLVAVGLGGFALSGSTEGEATAATVVPNPTTTAAAGETQAEVPVDPPAELAAEAPTDTDAAVPTEGSADPGDAPAPSSGAAGAPVEEEPEPEPQKAPREAGAVAEAAAPREAAASGTSEPAKAAPAEKAAAAATAPPEATGTADAVAKTSRVTFESTPPGATVKVDGESKGQTPLTLDLPYGGYVVEVALDGHTTARKSVDVGQPNVKVPVTLEKKLQSGKVFVALQGRDGQTLLVDGKAVGPLPATIDLVEGTHVFAVDNGDGTQFQVTREVTFNQGRAFINL